MNRTKMILTFAALFAGVFAVCVAGAADSSAEPVVQTEYFLDSEGNRFGYVIVEENKAKIVSFSPVQYADGSLEKGITIPGRFNDGTISVVSIGSGAFDGARAPVMVNLGNRSEERSEPLVLEDRAFAGSAFAGLNIWCHVTVGDDVFKGTQYYVHSRYSAELVDKCHFRSEPSKCVWIVYTNDEYAFNVRADMTVREVLSSKVIGFTDTDLRDIRVSGSLLQGPTGVSVDFATLDTRLYDLPDGDGGLIILVLGKRYSPAFVLGSNVNCGGYDYSSEPSCVLYSGQPVFGTLQGAGPYYREKSCVTLLSPGEQMPMIDIGDGFAPVLYERIDLEPYGARAPADPGHNDEVPFTMEFFDDGKTIALMAVFCVMAGLLTACIALRWR